MPRNDVLEKEGREGVKAGLNVATAEIEVKGLTHLVLLAHGRKWRGGWKLKSGNRVMMTPL